jgi:hypothetical protein
MGLGPKGIAAIDKIKSATPPAEYQKRLIANTNSDPDSKFFKLEYPDIKRDISGAEAVRDITKDITYIGNTVGVNAGIPPVQVNPQIKKDNLDSVKMNDFKVGMPSPPQQRMNIDRNVPTQGYRPRGYDNRSNCSCLDAMNHSRLCPVCQRYRDYEKNMYLVIMIMIIVIGGLIIFFLMKENKQLKNLLKK